MSRERRAVVHHVQDGGKSAVALLSRSARAGVRRKRASLELQRLGVNAPSDYRQKRHAAHRLTFVPPSDIPAGCFKVQGVVSAHSQNAATVTQAGGWNGLPAFSYLAQGQAGRPGGNSEPRELRGFPALVGGATWGTW